MNPDTGELKRIPDGDTLPVSFIPITEKQYVEMHKLPRSERKNWMRNKPCSCHSGKKFKNCCWLD